MLKKIILIITICVTAFVVTTSQGVEATPFDPYTMTWTSDLIGTNLYQLTGRMYTPEGLAGVKIEIPDSNYTTLSKSTCDSGFTFYDGSGSIINTYTIAELFNETNWVWTYYELNFQAIENETNDDLSDVSRIDVGLCQTYDSTFDASAVVTYFLSNTEIEFYYEGEVLGRDLFFYYSTPYATTGQLEWNEGTETIALSFDGYEGAGVGSGNLNGSGAYKSRIRLYSNGGINLEDTLYFEDYQQDNSLYYIFNIPYDTYAMEDIDYYEIKVYYEPMNSIILYNLSLFASIEFDASVYKVNYYSLGTLQSTSVILQGDLLPEPSDPTPPTSFEFEGWQYKDGTFVNFNEVPDDSYFIQSRINLYAKYQAVDSVAGDYNTTDPTPDANKILSSLNFLGVEDSTGYALVYLGVMALVIWFMISRKASAFVTLLVVLCITSIFIFLGLVPVIVSSIAVLVCSSGMIISFRTGRA